MKGTQYMRPQNHHCTHTLSKVTRKKHRFFPLLVEVHDVRVLCSLTLMRLRSLRKLYKGWCKFLSRIFSKCCIAESRLVWTSREKVSTSKTFIFIQHSHKLHMHPTAYIFMLWQSMLMQVSEHDCFLMFALASPVMPWNVGHLKCIHTRAEIAQNASNLLQFGTKAIIAVSMLAELKPMIAR